MNFVYLTVILMMTRLLVQCRSLPYCPQVAPGQDPTCRYGIETNECGHNVCLKGPGQICGGR